MCRWFQREYLNINEEYEVKQRIYSRGIFYVYLYRFFLLIGRQIKYSAKSPLLEKGLSIFKRYRKNAVIRTAAKVEDTIFIQDDICLKNCGKKRNLLVATIKSDRIGYSQYSHYFNLVIILS